MSEIINAPPIEEIKKFLEFLYVFVDNPEDLDINIDEGETSIIITIKTPHKKDTGRIIGKDGATVKAIRTLTINFVNAKYRKKVSLFIID